ncbi:hypothetical protein AB434_0212 [Heyndrickxia coagulans]|nr:hypothetical protein AB434_0212 [Heyndrickxia coagulans]
MHPTQDGNFSGNKPDCTEPGHLFIQTRNLKLYDIYIPPAAAG